MILLILGGYGVFGGRLAELLGNLPTLEIVIAGRNLAKATAFCTTRYATVQACIDAGINNLDFADVADFVFGISRLDGAAKAANIFVLSGASSFPVLTAAVLRDMAKPMQITSATGGIAPSPYAGVGLNVIGAVAGYVGGPLNLIRNGLPTQAIGLGESLRYTIAPPGAAAAQHPFLAG